MPLELPGQAELPMTVDETSSQEEPRLTRASAEDLALIERLLRKDESAFVELVRGHHLLMVRLAQEMVRSRAVAEEVVQETWQAVFERLASFEGRSSLRTWIFRILVKRAKSRGVRERRSVPMGAPTADGDDVGEATGQSDPPDRRIQSAALSSDQTPESRLLGAELRQQIEQAIEALPAFLKTVLTLRDVIGWTSDEVCNVLEITETNQRVTLHRARSRVRACLAPYLEGNEKSC